MANGTFGGGTGTTYDPWIIEDAADLNAIRTKAATPYFKLKNNIDLDVAPYNNTGWTPIPNLTSGVLDGDGYVIKSLKINNASLSRAGLFADISGGAVRDLGLVDVNIVANEKVGALAGRLIGGNSQIERCYSTGTISGKNSVGGLVGEVNQISYVMFLDCHSSASIAIEVDFAGGIVGYMTAPFTTAVNYLLNCYYNGIITGGNLLTAAPLCGKSENITVTNCFYDKEKTIQKGTFGTGLTSAEMQDVSKFDNWLYRYRASSPTWKFLDNCPPKLWYEDVGRILVSYGGKYYTFASGSWVLVSDTLPDRATFWAQGLKDLSEVPVAKIKELDQYGTIDIVNMIESKAQGASTKMKIQLLFDVLRTSKQLTLTSLTEDNLTSRADDFSPAARALSIIEEQKLSNIAMGLEITSQQELNVDAAALNGATGHINSKSLLIASDDEEPTAISPKSVTVGYSAANEVSTDTYKGFTYQRRSLTIASVKGNPSNSININIVGETEKPVDPELLVDSENHIRSKDIIIHTDAKKDRDAMCGNGLYEMYKTLEKRDRAMHVDTRGEGKSRYLISVNNGGKWLTYDSTSKYWVETELRQISDNGITIAQMADPTIWGSLPSDYRSRIKYAVGVRNESFNSTHTIRGLQIEFAPNQGPLVQDTQIQVQSDKVIISGTLFDAENDQVEYQVVTKQFNELTWRQITPEQPGWFKRKNGYQFYHEYDLTHFRAGDNYIKVSARDSRGIINEKEFSIILITGEPQIELNSQNEFYMSATINHSLGKKIRFRILVNNNQMTPVEGYTEWKEAPFSFDYSWDSKDLLYGLPNEITIEAVDELNTVAEIKFHVIGGYRSLLFKDENNFYYSTDKGDVLQHLDFGTVIGGLLSEPRIVFLENRTGLTLENISIWADNETQEERVKLCLSETLSPFIPVETISLANTMDNGEVKPFYVRIESDIDVESIQRKVFKIYAKGDPVVA
jgi:hypothetical protein